MAKSRHKIGRITAVITCAVLSSVGCKTPDDSASISAISSDMKSTKRLTVPTTVPTITPAPLADTGPYALGDAGGCRGASDCPPGQSCLFETAGCKLAGTCGIPNFHTCYVGIPMCSCGRGESFYGGGGCAGVDVKEPWELYGCPCTTSADCRGGQVCVPALPSGMSGHAKECATPKK